MSAYRELSLIMKGWLRRLRLQRAFIWALRGLDAGLAIALGAGATGLLQERLLRSQFLLMAGTAALATPILAGAIAYAWPIRLLHAARRLDRVLGLSERVSTALEFGRQDGKTGPLREEQLRDALAAAKQIRIARGLPVRLRVWEALPAVLLLCLLGLLWVRGEAWFQAAQRAAAVKQAVAQQQESIESLLAQIQSSDALTEEQKRALSEPLREARMGLQQNPSRERSLSVLASSAEQLRSLSEPHVQQLSQALQQAGQQLAGQDGSPLQAIGQSLANGDTIRAATQLKQLDVSQRSRSEQQQLAAQLQSMAQALASSNPSLAAQLRRAAQALQDGNATAAQEALNSAARSLAEAGQQVTFSQSASQAAHALQEGTDQILAAGGGQQGAQLPGAGISGGQGASGSGHGSGQAAQGPEAPNSPIMQNNGPGNGGESVYEQIYAPSLLGGQNDQMVGLPGSGQSGDVTGQGPSTAGMEGQSLVPYLQVLAQYEPANQQAIDNGSIPFEFMQVIHDYFQSIQP